MRVRSSASSSTSGFSTSATPFYAHTRGRVTHACTHARTYARTYARWHARDTPPLFGWHAHRYAYRNAEHRRSCRSRGRVTSQFADDFVTRRRCPSGGREDNSGAIILMLSLSRSRVVESIEIARNEIQRRTSAFYFNRAANCSFQCRFSTRGLRSDELHLHGESFTGTDNREVNIVSRRPFNAR